VDPAAVSVKLTPGSVKVDAEIQAPDANSAKSIEESMNKNNIAENVVEAASSIPGVMAAATGKLIVTSLEVKTEVAKPKLPEEESLIAVSMALNIDYQQLSADDKYEFKAKIRSILAEEASVDQAAVSVTLTPGSVKVDAEIQAPDANSAKSIEESMDKNNIAENVVEAANSIPGVKAAATGELKVTNLEVKTAATTTTTRVTTTATTTSTTTATTTATATSAPETNSSISIDDENAQDDVNAATWGAPSAILKVMIPVVAMLR
jgi:hypothetical protein